MPNQESSLFAVSCDLRPKLRKGPQSSRELDASRYHLELPSQLACCTPTAATMNTISPPPEFKRISGTKRLFGVVLGLGGAAAANALLGYSVFSFYTRNTTFVPYDTSSPDLLTPTFAKHNPLKNAPVCIDHAIKTLPLQKFRERYGLKEGDKVPVERLTTDFCRGIWSGIGFRVQRRYLEKKYRALPGREDHLWDVKQLEKSEYPVGEKIVDHFEVVEHNANKVSLKKKAVRSIEDGRLM